jgi:hypothetical protein
VLLLDAPRLDVKRLLLALPELRSAEGAVVASLSRRGAPEATLELWREVAREPSVADEDDEGWLG